MLDCLHHNHQSTSTRLNLFLELFWLQNFGDKSCEDEFLQRSEAVGERRLDLVVCVDRDAAADARPRRRRRRTRICRPEEQEPARQQRIGMTSCRVPVEYSCDACLTSISCGWHYCSLMIACCTFHNSEKRHFFILYKWLHLTLCLQLSRLIGL